MAGITAKSFLPVVRDKGFPGSEGRLSIDEVSEASKNGPLDEAFGTGTAAVISPVGLIRYKDEDYVINGGKMGEITKMLYDTIAGIQYGKLEDVYGWRTIIR